MALAVTIISGTSATTRHPLLSLMLVMSIQRPTNI
jgi:hypothetical protein